MDIYSVLPRPVLDALGAVTEKLESLSLGPLVDTPLYEPAVYFIRNRGKLARPILVLLGAYISGIEPVKVVDAAVSVELVHTASLIHDDLIDRDVMRRGVPTLHIRYGEEYAVLAGDVLLAKAIELVAPFGRRVVQLIANAALSMGAGEALDFMFQRERRIPTLETYIRIVRYKTAALIRASSMIGAIIAGDGRSLPLLESYGENVGVAFQIRDDVLNYLNIIDYKPKGGEKDVNAFRPNLISVLHNKGLEWWEALKEAVRMNHRYVSLAIEAASKLGDGGSALATYASWFDVKKIFSELGRPNHSEPR